MEEDADVTLAAPPVPRRVNVTAFSTPGITPSSRRLSSQFNKRSSPIRSARRLSWVSLQGRVVDAEETSSAKAIGGALEKEEAVAWDMFTPIHRILIVAVVAVATVGLKKERQIWRLRRSVDLRDQVLLSMQQKLDDLCEQVNNMKEGPESVTKLSLMKNKEFQLSNIIKSHDTKSPTCGCNCCDQHQVPSVDLKESFEKVHSGDEMFKFKMPIMDGAEQEERRMSDLSDWNSSVTSAADMQMSSLAIEQDIYNLRRECGEKDATIKELSAVVHAAEIANNKRVNELEDIIRRKNMIITKMKKDMVVMEQKMVHLLRLKRPSSSTTLISQQLPLPVMTDNLLYDMESTTSSSSSDSDGDLRRKPQAFVTKEEGNFSSNENDSAAQKNHQSCSRKALQPHPVSPLTESNMNQRLQFAGTLRSRHLVSARGDQNGSKKRVQRGAKETNTLKKWH